MALPCKRFSVEYLIVNYCVFQINLHSITTAKQFQSRPYLHHYLDWRMTMILYTPAPTVAPTLCRNLLLHTHSTTLTLYHCQWAYLIGMTRLCLWIILPCINTTVVLPLTLTVCPVEQAWLSHLHQCVHRSQELLQLWQHRTQAHSPKIMLIQTRFSLCRTATKWNLFLKFQSLMKGWF